MVHVSDIQLVLFDETKNKSIVLEGDLELDSESLNVSSSHNASKLSHDPFENYDQQGALLYVIAVIVVYGLAMLFIVFALAKRKSKRKNLDAEVNCYMKGLDQAEQQAKEETVRRMRLRWPGNFIGLRFTGHPARSNISASDVEDYPEWPCLESQLGDLSDIESEDSYTLMPATTVPTGTYSLLPTIQISDFDDLDSPHEEDHSPNSLEHLDVDIRVGYKPRSHHHQAKQSSTYQHSVPQKYDFEDKLSAMPKSTAQWRRPSINNETFPEQNSPYPDNLPYKHTGYRPSSAKHHVNQEHRYEQPGPRFVQHSVNQKQWYEQQGTSFAQHPVNQKQVAYGQERPSLLVRPMNPINVHVHSQNRQSPGPFQHPLTQTHRKEQPRASVDQHLIDQTIGKEEQSLGFDQYQGQGTQSHEQQKPTLDHDSVHMVRFSEECDRHDTKTRFTSSQTPYPNNKHHTQTTNTIPKQQIPYPNNKHHDNLSRHGSGNRGLWKPHKTAPIWLPLKSAKPCIVSGPISAENHRYSPGGVSPRHSPGGVSPGHLPGGVSPGHSPGGVSHGHSLGAVSHEHSPGGVSHAHSPGGVSHGHSPGGVSHGHSPGGVNYGHSPDGVSHGHSPGGVSHGHSPGAVSHEHSPGGVSHAHSPRGVSHGHSPGGVSHGHSPRGVSHGHSPVE